MKKKSNIISETSDKPVSKTSEHYISNSDLYQEFVIWQNARKEAELNNKPEPKIPESIGKAIMQIANNFIKKHNWQSSGKWKEEMASDAILNCLPARAKITTEDGIKTIGDIVKNKYMGKVLSMDNVGNIVWNNITGHMVKENSGANKKDWVRVECCSLRNHVVCTPEHLLAVVKNPLDFKIEYVQAKDAIGMWSIRKYDKKFKNSKNSLYNKDVFSLLLGGLIGDGYITKSGQASFNRGDSQKEYVLEKQKLFGGTIYDYISKTGYGKEFLVHRLTLPNNSQTKYVRELIYSGEKKIVSTLFDYIDEKSLAMWYMDDGCLGNTRGKYYVTLCTHGFSYEENSKIAEFLHKKWGIDCKLTKANGLTDTLYYIRIYGENVAKFIKLISKYIFPSMEYKIPEELRDKNKFVYSDDMSEYVLAKVKKVVNIHKNTRSSLYDIEVENTHNFFAGNTLVHNCIMYVRNFNPEKSKNPFSYFTQTCYYAFLRRIDKEKTHDYIKHKSMLNSALYAEIQENGMQEDDEHIIDAFEYDNSGVDDFISAFEMKNFGRTLDTNVIKGKGGKTQIMDVPDDVGFL